MNQFNFSWFTKTRSRLSDPRISIGKNGSFGLNAALVRQFKLRDYPFVILGYDKSRNAIGFRFVKEKDAGALTIRFTESDSATTNSKNFCFINKLNPEKIVGRHVVEEVKNSADEIILATNFPK